MVLPKDCRFLSTAACAGVRVLRADAWNGRTDPGLGATDGTGVCFPVELGALSGNAMLKLRSRSRALSALSVSSQSKQTL
jgi:hypothetical protein